MNQQYRWANISWLWVALSFVFQIWPVGLTLLALKLVGMNAVEEAKKKNIYRPYQRTAGTQYRTGQQPGNVGEKRRTPEQFDREAARDVEARPVNESEMEAGRAAAMDSGVDADWDGTSYHGGRSAAAGTAGGRTQQTSGGYRPVYRRPNQTGAPRSREDLLTRQKLNPNSGKGLQLAGWIVLGVGAFVWAVVMLGGVSAGLLTALQAAMISALSICTPGAVLAIVGTHMRTRAARCRNHLAMIGNRRTVSLDALDAASPGNFKTVCKDLDWMLGNGFFPGAYLDMSRRVLTYPGEEQEMAEARQTAEAPVTGADGQKLYPEEQTICRLNARIQDAYVSQRIDRLAQLTHQIFAYVEANPEKENAIRQFKTHYLPKTIKILQSYARLEQQNIDGENIRAAMKDVEQIMDKLVSGFEKQLDLLFGAEAMDVTTDISVLESMMNMEGLGGLDPFGSMRSSQTGERN